MAKTDEAVALLASALRTVALYLKKARDEEAGDASRKVLTKVEAAEALLRSGGKS